MPTPSVIISQAKQGFKPCSACGEWRIHPDETSWKKRCSACDAAGKTARFCRTCGEPLPTRDVAFFKKKGIPNVDCFYCKHNQTAEHPVHGVKLPRSCYATLR